MTARRRRAGKEPAAEEADPGDGPDERLPERLFATDRYPSRRLKVYSSLEYLVVIRDVLRGTPELDRILGSCFGKLFELPARRCSYSSVMIHAMLARQVVTKKRYEVWPVFGGNPFRFSMVEFASVTGLPCGEFDDGYAVDYQPTYKDEDFAYWDKLFEGKRDITIPEVVKMVVEDKSISRGRRLKLCLIIIVDGVLIASTQPAKPTPKHVKLVENLKDFFGFQWGRESFYWTVSTMIPGKKILGKRDDPNGEFCSKLRQKTKKMSGLPLALQLEDALSAEEKEEHPDNPEDAGDPGGDVGPGRETAADGSEDESITDGRGEGEMGYSKEDSEDEDKEVDRESNSEAMDVEVGQSSPEGPPPVLVPLKEGDGVPLQWVESGVTDKRGGGGVVYRATTSKTLYLTEDDVKDEDLMDSDGLDKLVGVIFSAHGSGSAEGELGSESKRVTEGADEGEQEERKKSDGDETAGGSTNIVEEPAGLGQGGEEEITNDSGRIEKVGCTSVREGKQYKCTRREAVEEELVSENAEAVVPATESVEVRSDFGIVCVICRLIVVMQVQDGEESKEMVTYLSDSSPCARSEKHKPVEAEANLASLLLAKADFTLEQIVPDVEDIDFGYFETVLQANPKVLHLGVGKYDLDNQFFLDLATPRKWVSTKHMEVLVDYVGERHATLLKERRVMFVAPWFVKHLSGKARAFNAATYKGRLFSDPKLAGFLTKEEKKLGVDVDNFYTPMIWDTNHWVGLRISITGWSVLVLDPDRSLRDMDGVMAIMTPLAKMLPYLVRKVCPAEFLMGHGLEPFGVELMANGYQNARSGDCGPVAMKFMELHATGVEEPQVDDLTDGLVDIFRKLFAMDVYRDWIVPLYMGGNAGE
ncbi:hypothetical protein Bca4012_083688 [Brassica carinata]